MKQIENVEQLTQAIREAYNDTHAPEHALPLDKKIAITLVKPAGTRNFEIDLGTKMTLPMITAILFAALHETMELEYKKHASHACPEKEFLARLMYNLNELLSDESFDAFSDSLFKKVKKGELYACPMSDLEFKDGYCANCNESHPFPNL